MRWGTRIGPCLRKPTRKEAKTFGMGSICLSTKGKVI